MALIPGTIPSFIGGVSQQDASIRSASQLDEAINVVLSPALGAGKRPPAQVVVQIEGPTEDSFYHSIVRDSAERYLVVIEGSTLRVFNHTADKEYSVSIYAGSEAYFATTGRQCESLRACTVADTTFIVNREKKVAMASDLSPGGISGTVNTFADLPKSPAVGGIYAITGDPNNNNDTYYVQAQSSTAYTEVAKPGLTHKLNKTTMPHVLKRIPDEVNPDGFFFAFGPQEWDVRPAGDEESNPPPSFVGDRLFDVFFARDRLSFVTTENAVLSEVGFYFNFWRTTVTQLLDSDPVDVRPPTTEVVSFRQAVPFQSATMLFGTANQVQLTADPIMSPRTAKLTGVTNYECNPNVKPVLAGDSMFYLSDGGDSTAVREYFVADSAVTGDAADATAHVPAYIPKGARAMQAFPERDMLFVAIENHPYQLYVHSFYWQNEQKAQSAWYRWKFSGVGSVLHMHRIDGCLYLVAVAPAGGIELLKVDMTPKVTMASLGIPFDILLDRRATVTGVYVEFGDYTKFVLPYALASLDGFKVIRSADFGAVAGTILTLTGATLENGGTEVHIPGNMADKRVVCGLDYDCDAVLSEQFVRNDSQAVLVGRLTIRTLTVAYTDTAYFQVRVAPHGRTPVLNGVVTERIEAYDGRTIGDAGFALSSPKLHRGAFRCLVGSRSDHAVITLSNPTPYPSWFQSAQWEGMFTSRARV